MRPLAPDSIRIVFLKAGLDSDPIQVSLTQVNLGSPPAYEALSYCWGKPVENTGFAIVCDGEQLGVTKNLHEALHFLRFANQDRVLWIDAICINQKCDDEKSQQVGVMKDIYEKASQVIIWLGMVSPEERPGFAMLEMFKQSIDMNSGYKYHFDRNMEDGIMPPVQSSAWSGLVQLFQRNWFFRIWVIQEAVKAQKILVVCGSEHVSWDVIVQVSKACQEIGYLGAYRIENSAAGTHSAAVIDSLKNSDGAASLMTLLARTRRYEATDARDKVFALLGLAVDSNDFGIADYKIKPEDVYISVARRSLLRKSSLTCLSNAGLVDPPGLSDPQPIEVPTWVPNCKFTTPPNFLLPFLPMTRSSAHIP